MGRFSANGRALTRAAVLCAVLTACTPLRTTHGYVPVESELSQITVGTSTREEVASLIGKPTIDEFLQGGAWYYIQSRYERVAYKAPVEVDREVLAVSFDPSGRVSNIERYGLEDGRIITLSRRVTDSAVQDVSVLRRIFGALGGFKLPIGE